MELKGPDLWAAKTALTVIRKFRSEGGMPDQYAHQVSSFLQITEPQADQLILYLMQEGFLPH